jgi:hypothetical protein
VSIGILDIGFHGSFLSLECIPYGTLGGCVVLQQR